MITVEKMIDLPDTYPLERLGRLEELLFFDIETTGFSGEHSNLYLIGCTCYRNKSWHLIQWFADTVDSEKELLISFFEFLNQFTTVVHFNGDGFDIPYLLKRCQILGLPYDFSGVASIDIYKRIKPYRKLLKLENLKQKSIERFLGICRQDQYNGGQLIQVYKDYLKTREDELYDMLMLHNREDLEGMPLILPILNYPDFLEHDLVLKNVHIREQQCGQEDLPQILALTLESHSTLPVPLENLCPDCNITIHCQNNHMNLEIPLYHGTLRYFYPNYKDYYYLIYEDTAVHKSIGDFVDRSARKKATAQTCYTKRCSTFLPQPDIIWEPALKENYQDKLTYVEYSQELFCNADLLKQYILCLLKQLM